MNEKLLKNKENRHSGEIEDDPKSRSFKISKYPELRRLCEMNYLTINKIVNLFIEIGMNVFFDKDDKNRISKNFCTIQEKERQLCRKYPNDFYEHDLFKISTSVFARIIENENLFRELLESLEDEHRSGNDIDFPDFICKLLNEAIENRN